MPLQNLNPEATRMKVPCALLLATVMGAANILGAPHLAAGQASARPKLIVVISVDQLAYTYLERFRAGFAEDGFFRTIEREGASLTDCHHRHAFTFTAPGHSVMLTGCYPDKTAIIGNGWFDPDWGRDRYCVEDPDVQLVGLPEGSGEGMSPASLQSETLGDVLKEASGGAAKVIGVSLKDRAGILMAGRKADGAYWFKDRQWITSTYYRRDLPGYVRVHNQGRIPERFAGHAWYRLLPESSYRLYRPDDYPHENDGYGLGRAFPHQLAAADDPRFDKQLPVTPVGNRLTLSAARLLIEYESLGADDVTDLLCIGLSTNDYLGHQYGPYSLEVQDITYRTDRRLGGFLRYLDRQVGKGQWLLALTADHGVAPIPEFVAEKGMTARRNPLGDQKLDQLQRTLEGAVRQAIGPPPEGEQYVLQAEASQVYLSRDRSVLPEENLAAARQAVRDALLENDAVLLAVTREELGVPEWKERSPDPADELSPDNPFLEGFRQGDVSTESEPAGRGSRRADLEKRSRFSMQDEEAEGSFGIDLSPPETDGDATPGETTGGDTRPSAQQELGPRSEQDEELLDKLRKTFHAQRSGDVLFVLRPYFIQSRSAATHGSPWPYDTHVPLLWLGAGIQPGKFAAPSSPAQIAPTLAKLLGVRMPNDCVEKPLDEVITGE